PSERRERFPIWRGVMTDSILIIGGEATLKSEIALALGEAGFAIAAVPDYPETLFKQNGVKPDIVIMDEVLPSRRRHGGLLPITQHLWYSRYPAWGRF
ncbi:MAG: hypothetical protein NWE87_02230, partial [Candidatus Bathyarchaeota archaeon]|nr:hypothetical protein [Candidatus Bathyarchaeota archaeon]